MILLRMFSEEGRKKLEERAQKKANKRKWFLDQARESDNYAWKRDIFDRKADLHAAEGRSWLGKHTNEEAIKILDKGAKPVEVGERKYYPFLSELFGTRNGIPTRKYNNDRLGNTSAEDIVAAEDALRAGRKVIKLENEGYHEIARKTPQEVSLLDRAINQGKAGILDDHKMEYKLEDSLKDKKKELERAKKKAEEVAKEAERKLQKMKSIKKAAPWVIGGTVVAGGATIGTVKLINKKKSKNSNNSKKS